MSSPTPTLAQTDATHLLSYPSLIRALSSPPHLPAALHARNTLLAPFTSLEHPEEHALFTSSSSKGSPAHTHAHAHTRGAVDSAAAWGALGEWYPAVQVGVFGDVPREVLAAAQAQAQAHAGEQTPPTPTPTPTPGTPSGCWALAILKPPVTRLPGAGNQGTFFRPPNLSVWLSEEGALAARQLHPPAATGAPRPAVPPSPHAQALLQHIGGAWLPAALRAYHAAMSAYVGRSRRVAVALGGGGGAGGEARKDVCMRYEGRDGAGEDEVYTVLGFAMDENVLAFLRGSVWQGGDARPQAQGQGQGQAHIDAKLLSVCASLRRDEPEPEPARGPQQLGEPTSAMAAAAPAARRWALDTLSERSVDVVLGANAIPFPRQHVLRKPWLSVFVWDREGPASATSAVSAADGASGASGASGVSGASAEPEKCPASSAPSSTQEPTTPAPAPAPYTYPTSQAAGHPAGWAYTHDDLSLGSLHVAAPYRSRSRVRDAVEDAGRGGGEGGASARAAGDSTQSAGEVPVAPSAAAAATTTSTSGTPTSASASTSAAGAAGPGLGLGRLLISALSPRIAAQQGAVLRLLGVGVGVGGVSRRDGPSRSASPSRSTSASASTSASPRTHPVNADVELDNPRAMPFYERVGFTEVGRRCWAVVTVRVGAEGGGE